MENHSVFLTINAANQKTELVNEGLNVEFGGKFLYCAPYSPELKSIERGFSNLKNRIRKRDSPENAVDPVGLIEEALRIYAVGVNLATEVSSSLLLYYCNDDLLFMY